MGYLQSAVSLWTASVSCPALVPLFVGCSRCSGAGAHARRYCRRSLGCPCWLPLACRASLPCPSALLLQPAAASPAGAEFSLGQPHEALGSRLTVQLPGGLKAGDTLQARTHLLLVGSPV